MKLKKAKYMLIVFCLLMVVSLLACSVTKIKWIGYLGIAFALLGVLFWVIFGRCPHCGGFYTLRFLANSEAVFILNLLFAPGYGLSFY